MCLCSRNTVDPWTGMMGRKYYRMPAKYVRELESNEILFSEGDLTGLYSQETIDAFGARRENIVIFRDKARKYSRQDDCTVDREDVLSYLGGLASGL